MKKLLLASLLSVQFLSFAQIETGMIAHFPFNNNLNDLSNSAVSLTGTGITYGPGRNADPNGAAVFNGAASIAFDDPDLRVPFPITVSFWINLNSIPASSTPVFHSENQYNLYSGYFISINANGEVAMHMGDGTGWAGVQYRRSYISSQALTTGTWYHVLCIYRTAQDMDIYIDCNQDSGAYSGTGSTTMAYSNVAGSMGYSDGNPSNTNFYADMSLDQLAIWSRELTPSEIAFLCDTNNPLTINELENENNKELIKIVDIMGRETEFKPNMPLIYIYSDGSKEKVMKVE